MKTNEYAATAMTDSELDTVVGGTGKCPQSDTSFWGRVKEFFTGSPCERDKGYEPSHTFPG